MWNRLAAAPAIAVVLITTLAGQPLPNFRADTRLVVLHATVKNKQGELVTEALRRAHAYFEAGADCVYPIALRETTALAAFVSEAGGPVNVLAIAGAPSLAELAELGVARVSYGSRLHRQAMEEFESSLRRL